jgi:acyl-CoA synthetase (AMP-forming)/AMP-acid ligase II
MKSAPLPGLDVESLATRVAAWALATPHAPALVAPGRAPLTYAELEHRGTAVAAALRAAGVTPGARVAVAMPHGIDLAATIFGITCVAACLPLDGRDPHAVLVRRLRRSRAAAIVVAEAADPAAVAARDVGVPVVASSDIPDDIFEARRMIEDRPAPQDDDECLVLHTSGTTGEPKRIVLLQRNVAVSAACIGAALALAPTDRCLCFMPLFHVHGLVGALAATLWSGGSVACVEEAAVGSMPRWLAMLQPTWYTATPPLHGAVLDALRRDLSWRGVMSLRFVRSASAALPARLAVDLESELGVPVVEAYGMTEAAHQIASNPLPPAPRRIGTVGVALGTEVAILDDAGHVLPLGRSGEIAIRGDNVASIQETDTDDGRVVTTLRAPLEWLRTGDEGRLDTEGYLTLEGRLKDVINRGGAKIAPREVEQVLLEHDTVRNAVAFGVPHPSLGEDLAAAVVLHVGATTSDDVLREFLFARMAAHKVPTRIAIVDDIPRTRTGKVQRGTLAQVLADALAAAYTAPSGADETAIAAIFAEVLEIAAVGARDNFFALGGDSLRGTQVLARVQARCGVTLPPAVLFHHATPSALAAAIERVRAGHDCALPGETFASASLPPLRRRGAG